MGYFPQSDIKNRAKKAYQSQPHGCELMIRELMSNAYHALLIKKPENPKISILIDPEERRIIIEDNGCGFTSEDRETMDILDKASNSKETNHLPSKGEGRLAFVYFANSVYYETVSEENGIRQLFNFSFPLPNEDDLLSELKGQNTEKPTGTKATVRLPSESKVWDAFQKKMIKTDKNTFAEFLKKEFFYFFIGLENLLIKFHILSSKNNDEKIEHISHQKTSKVQFQVKPVLQTDLIFEENTSPITIEAYIHEYSQNTSMEILVVAHDVTVKVKTSEKIVYDCLFPNKGIRIYIASHYFSNKVVNSGLELNLDEQIVKAINAQLKVALDEYFAADIRAQYETNMQTFESVKKNMGAFASFLPPKDFIHGFREQTENDFQSFIFKEYAEATTNYLSNKEKEDNRIVHTSLHLYLEHRKRIIDKFGKMIARWTENGKENKTVEFNIHDLLFQRGYKSEDPDDAYSKHNLWLIDDKLSYFTTSESTKPGQALSDIYLYLDQKEKPGEIIIIELKHPNNAHNPTDMLTQVKNYAHDLYHNKDNSNLSRDRVNTKQSMFYGYIIASKEDIDKAINYDGNCHKISFLEYSYYTMPTIPNADGKIIHIELLSFTDIKTLAQRRHKAFFRFLGS